MVRRFGLLLVIALTVMVALVGCGGDDDDAAASDPAAILAEYQGASNTGDIDALISLYAEDAVVTDHPLDDDGLTEGVEAIRALDEFGTSIQRSEDATEFVDVRVSGNSVTFGHRFWNNRGQCFGGGGHEVTVEDGKITRYAWGTSGEACE